ASRPTECERFDAVAPADGRWPLPVDERSGEDGRHPALDELAGRGVEGGHAVVLVLVVDRLEGAADVEAAPRQGDGVHGSVLRDRRLEAVDHEPGPQVEG